MHHFERHGDKCYYLILSGDQLYQMNFKEMLSEHISSGSDITIAAKPMPSSEAPNLGVMRVDGDKNIVEFAEKPKDPNVINSFLIGGELREKIKKSGDFCLASMGIYIFSQKVLEQAMSGTEMDFGKEIIPGLLGKKKLSAYIFDHYWEDIGTVGAFFEANLALTDAKPPFDFYSQEHTVYTHCRFLPGARINNSALKRCNISDGSVITEATLERCVIGIRSKISAGTKLNSVVMMGADYYETEESIRENRENGIPPIGIGSNTEIKNAIIFDNVQVPHYNYVGDSILGYKSHMGAGSITSNVKSDKTLVTVKGEVNIETGLKKFGAILGDYVEVGCNSVLNPGTVIGRNTNIYPLSCVRGVIPAASIYKDKNNIVSKN